MLDRGFNRFDQFRSGVGREQAGHIFDGHGVATHGFEFFGQGHEMRNVVHRAGGVANRAFGMLAGFFHGFNRDAQVAQIVHGIEDAEHVDTVIGGFLDEGAYHIVGVMAIAEQILTAQQHLNA